MAQNDTIVSDLIFNSMSQAEFNAQMQAETLDPNQFYLTPDDTNEKFEEIDAKIDETVANFEELSAHIDTYSDTEFIARQAMPSRRTIDLTLGASGSAYTAPADGTVLLVKSGNTGQYVTIDCYRNKAYFNYSAASQACSLSLQVSKGDSFVVWYDASGATDRFVFIYANGAK